MQISIVKIANTKARVANTRRRGKDRLLFNPKHLQDEDKSQRRECKDKEIHMTQADRFAAANPGTSA